MNQKTYRDREILAAAHEKGTISTLGAFFRLSGPGWLQSAITLGGGSLGGALYLGVIGGNSMLWLQMVAIIIGVIMLSAISYVTLSTGKRPYQAINEYVNPVLGVSWITATILANMIFILPQFSLCYDALDTNFGIVGKISSMLAGENATLEAVARAKYQTQIFLSAVMAIVAFVIVVMSFKPGWMSFIFDLILKLIVGLVVVCFVASVFYLTQSESFDWVSVLWGFVPDVRQWFSTAPALTELSSTLGDDYQKFWNAELLKQQREVMISTTATAVGINMTFLLPYSMLARGWDKPFRGLARWDLITGMAIPFIIVTTCIALASAHAFHAKIDAEFTSTDPAVFSTSGLFGNSAKILKKRILLDEPGAFASIEEMPAKTEEEKQAKVAAEKALLAERAATLSESEKTLAASLAQPNSAQLAKSLEPVLGDKSKFVFGLGALGMGFSTIIILMLINGYALAEIFDRPDSNLIRAIGAAAAGIMGFCWFLIWVGGSRTFLGILASGFAAILLPIAYIAFFALMNNQRLMGEEKPTGVRMIVWNVLMTIGVLGALAQAILSVITKSSDPVTGNLVIGGVAVFVLLALVGFSARPKTHEVPVSK